MNQSQIHPALRQSSLSSPPNPRSSPYPEGPPSGYPNLQLQQQQQQQQQHQHQQSGGSGSSYHATPSYYATSQPTVDSPEEQSPGTNPSDPNDLKRPRACEACRSLKVKCEPDEASPEGSCKRCAKARRQCIVTVPSRKRQKKTDSRVAELEKKIDALTATLNARGSVDDVAVDPAIAHEHRQQRANSATDQWQQSSTNAAGVKRKTSDTTDYFGGDLAKAAAAAAATGKFRSPPPPVPQFPASTNDRPSKPDTNGAPFLDVIEQNLMDMKDATRCFERYVTELCHTLPLVVFSPSVKAEDLRKNKPILFLAVLSVSAGTIRPDLQSRLINEVTKILADRIIVGAEKSMELVQTIQVLTVFYQPPERYEELNFNQLTHMAAVMALDLGMGKRTKKGAIPMWNRYLDRTKWLPDPTVAETRRCWLGIYYMCSNSAMSLRRPLLIRWSSYADECLQVLDSARDALPSDRWLCHMVKAQHLGEDIGVEFGMDDPASVLSLTDPKTQRHLKAFEQQLHDWHDTGGDMMNSPIMKHTEAIINLYMHEIAMHHNHNIDDFRPPFYTTPIEGPPDPEHITPAHIEALTACLHSAHSVFESIFEMDITSLRALPTHFYVRSSYAAVALIKLYSSVAMKGSKFSSMFKPEDLKVDEYLDRLIHRLKTVAEGGTSRVAQKFSMIFTMLRNWHLKRADPPNGEGPGPLESRGPMVSPANMTGPANPPPTAWSTQHRLAMEQNGTTHASQTGLQMLSEAAMGPGRSMGVQAQQGQWLSPPQQMGQMQGMPGPMMATPEYAMMGYNEQMPMGFTPEDFMGFGLGDEWVHMGFNPQWSM